MTRYLLAGGGTAGHVNPLLALANYLRSQGEQEILVLGAKNGVESWMVPAAGFPLLTIPKLPLPRKINIDLLRFPGKLSQQIRSLAQQLEHHRVDIVVGFGGYVSAPAYVAAKLRGVPTVAHEGNMKPGLANRLARQLTPYVGESFGGSLPGASLVGMPLRNDIRQLPRYGSPERQKLRGEAAQQLGLDPQRPALLVFGGSLGSARINHTVAACAPRIVEQGWQVLHLTGVNMVGCGKPAISTGHYHLHSFLEKMHLAFAVADLVLCRSGGSTLAELTCLGLPAVLVPYPVGNGEQEDNAAFLSRNDAAYMMPDANLNSQTLMEVLEPLLQSSALRLRISRNSRSHGISRATENLANLINTALKEAPPRD